MTDPQCTEGPLERKGWHDVVAHMLQHSHSPPVQGRTVSVPIFGQSPAAPDSPTQDDVSQKVSCTKPIF